MRKIISYLLAVALLSGSTAFAEVGRWDFDINADNIEGQTAPTRKELMDSVEAAYDEGNMAKVKSISAQDYSDYVAATEKITVTIDENDMWEYNEMLFGLEIELDDYYSTFYSNGKLTMDFQEFAKRTGKIPVIRFGGATAMKVDPFLSMIGPQKTRKTTPVGTYTKGQDTFSGGGAAPYMMGIPEWLTAMAEVNDGEYPLIQPCIPLWTMPTENIVSLAKYLYDDAGESEWGAMRAADGFEEPIGVYCWELGNELDYVTYRTKVRMEEYVTKAKAAIEAIKSVNPDAMILANGITAPGGNYWQAKEYEDEGVSWTCWHMGIMPELVSLVDAISFHPYYDGYSVEYCNNYFTDKMKRDIDKMVEEQDIRDEDGNLKDIKVIATEHNRWTDPSDLNTDFFASLSVSHFFNACFARPWYHGANLNALVGKWCGFWYNGADGLVMTPTAQLHKMYYENIGDRICASSWVRHEEDGTVYDPNFFKDEEMSKFGNAENFSVLATPSGENELKVFLTNKTEYVNREITFDFKQHDYTLVSETRFYAPNTASTPVDEDSESLVKIETKELNIPNCTTYTTPTQGCVILTFKTTDKMLQLGEDPSDAIEGVVEDAAEVEEEGLVFADISDSYAKNEITALASEGLISGRSEGRFDPKAYITRAEFSYILGKAMGLSEYKGSLWEDVAADKWYAGMLNALSIEKIFSGSYFRPEDNMKFGEAMDLAGWLCKEKGLVGDTSDIYGFDAQLGSDAAYAVNKGIFSKLLEQGTLDTDRYMTREDAAAVMYKLSKLVK